MASLVCVHGAGVRCDGAWRLAGVVVSMSEQEIRARYGYGFSVDGLRAYAYPKRFDGINFETFEFSAEDNSFVLISELASFDEAQEWINA